MFLFVVESRAPSHKDAPVIRRRDHLAAAAAHPVLSRVLLVTLISTAAFAGMEAIFGLWTQARFDWGPRQVGLCFAVIGIIASVGQGLITGRLARRFGEAKVLTTGLAIIAVSLALTPFVPTSAFVPLAVGCTAFGQSLVFPCIVGPDLARHPARQAGRHAGAEHGRRLAGPDERPAAGRTAVRPGDRRTLLVRGGADAAGHRLRPDHRAPGQGRQLDARQRRPPR